jgi:uncharacterized protein YegP (UPF0339 family)
MATRRRRTPGTFDGAAPMAESTRSTGELHFQVYEESSGRHRWRLTSSDGRPLATSCESFASRDDAQRAVDKSR